MKTKKLIVPIALLVLAVMAVTSTTFAWFTSNGVVTGNLYKIGVTTEEEQLYIVDTIPNQSGAPTAIGNWDTVANDIIDTTSFFNGINLSDITHLSSNKKALSNGAPNADVTATAANGFYNKSVSPAVVNVDYLEFVYTFWYTDNTKPLYFNAGNSSLGSSVLQQGRSLTFGDNERRYFVSLDGILGDLEDAQDELDDVYDEIVVPTQAEIEAYAAATAAIDAQIVIYDAVLGFYGVDTGDNGSTGILNSDRTRGYAFNTNGFYVADPTCAARVMFTQVESGSTTTAAYGASNAAGTAVAAEVAGAKNVVWNPKTGSNYDNASYVFDMQDLYGIVTRGELGDLPSAVYNPYNSTNAAYHGTEVEVTTGGVEVARFDTTSTGSRLGVLYYRADVKVDIWLEGWDPDCFNVILGSMFDASMIFTTTAVQ